MAAFFHLQMRIVFPLVISFVFICSGALTCAADPFPNPPVIQPVVNFWLSIYTQYDLDQGIVHDSRYPEIVYDLIELKHSVPKDRTNENKQLLEQIDNHIDQTKVSSDILEKLQKELIDDLDNR